MKLKLLSLSMSLTLFTQITPALGNDIKIFPCGGTATYSVMMPLGVLRDGGECSGSLTIDSSVKIIDSFAFRHSQLKSVIIPDSVIEIGWQAFFGSLNLENVKLGSSVEYVGNRAFQSTKVSEIQFPSKLLAIGAEAFASTYLGWGGVKITLPNSLRSIGDKAFWGSRIEQIVIPDNLIFLGKDVFVITNLKAVEYCGNLEGFYSETNSYAKPAQFVEPNCPPEKKLQYAANSSLEVEANLAADFLKTVSGFSDVSKEQLLVSTRAANAKIKQRESAAAELKAKQEAEAKAAAELKAKQEAEAAALAAAAKSKKTTITCVRGKLTKKVTAVKPKCPKGYKKK